MPLILTITKIPADRVSAPAGTFLSPAYDAMIDLTHRMACEAAQLHSIEGKGDWRDFMSRETAAAVGALEEAGWVEWRHEDG